MSQNETLSMVVDVDTKPGEQNLDALRANAMRMGGGLDKATNSIHGIEKAVIGSKAHVTNFGGALEKLGGRDAAATERAMRGLGQAFGGVAGPASEALGLVGDFSDVLLGGGFTVALGLGAAGVAALWTEIEKLGQIEKDVAATSKASVEASFRAIGETASKVTEQVDALSDSIRTLGLNQFEIAFMDANDAAQANAEAIANLSPKMATLKDEATKAALSLAVLSNKQSDLAVSLQQKIDRYKEASGKIDSHTIALETNTAKANEALDKGERYKAGLDAIARSTAKATGNTSDLSVEYAKLIRELDAAKLGDFDPLASDIDVTKASKLSKTGADKMDKAYSENPFLKQESENKAYWLKFNQDMEDQDYEQRKAKSQAFHDAVASHAQWGADMLVGTSQQLIQGLVDGQDFLLERALANIATQTGQHLIGVGTRLAAEAIAAGLTPGGQGLSVAQAGGAALLIGTGLALGGIGYGLEKSIGVKEDKAAAKQAKVDRGVNSRRSSGGSSGSGGAGGPTAINVIYNAPGPRPEDAGRQVVNAMRTARQRGAV